MDTTVAAVLAAVGGLALGHLFHLIFGRFYTGSPILGPLRPCEGCGRGLDPIDLLPAAGFLLRRGRCPACGTRMPLRALLLPLGGAVLFALSAAVFDGTFGAALLGGFFATVFLTLTLTDMDRRLLPNRIVYPATLLAIALSWTWPDSSAAGVAAGGIVAAALALVLLLFSLPFGANAFGMGDVKMIVLIGFVVGFPSIIIGLFLGTFAAGLAALFLLLTRIKSRKDYMPHGPFLALGAVIALFWGSDIWDWYTDR